MSTNHEEAPRPPPVILVADDDVAMRRMLGASLRRHGFVVDECENGLSLLRRLQRESEPGPDLVISDVRMPEADGLDVLHWMRRRLPDVPVILITAFGDSRTHRRARRMGAALVLDKPFALDDLHGRVLDLLA